MPFSERIVLSAAYSKIWPHFLCCALCLFAAAPPLWGQAQETFSESIDVRVINVEVVVTDKDGNRVTDLAPEDFRLSVDKRPTDINYFYEVHDGEVHAVPEAEPADGEKKPKKQPQAPSSSRQLGEKVATNYLVFIDEYFGQPSHRNLILDQIETDLADLEPQDRIAMVAFTGTKIEKLLDWTHSPDDFARAVEQARGRPAHRVLAERKATGLVEGGQIGGAESDAAHIAMKWWAERLRTAYRGVATTLRGYSRTPGRKALLLLSGGWPYDVPAANGVSFRSKFWDTRKELREIADIANQTGFTIYSVDLPGTETRFDTADTNDPHPLDPATDAAFNIASDQGASLEPLADPEAPIGEQVLDFNQQRFNRAGQELENESSLLILAEETGGQAMLNQKRMNAFSTANTDTRSYYSLGFHFSHQGDDKYHKIQVEVDRPDVTVRARQGFTDVSRDSEIDWVVESSLMLDHQSGLPRLEAQLGEPTPKGRRWLEVPFAIAIPLQQIAVVPHNDGGRTLLELRIAALSEKGERSEITQLPLELDLEPAMMNMAYIRYDAAMRVRSQKQDLVLTLYDRLTGTVLVSKLHVDPG